MFWKFPKIHTQFVQNATFELWEKNETGCLLSSYKKIDILPGFSEENLKKHGFYTSEIRQKSEHFVQQRRCYNQSNWTYNLAKATKSKKTFFFLIKCGKSLFSLLYFFRLFKFFHQLLFLPCCILQEISLSYQGMYATASHMLTTSHL